MIDFKYYESVFETAIVQLDKSAFSKRKIDIAVGRYGESVFLKLYKSSWASPGQDALTADSRIFFSVWVDEIKRSQFQLMYNIHALKLRQLHGYNIESRKFAAAFRQSFSKFEGDWPAVNIQLGPLTLMQGAIQIRKDDLSSEIVRLANQFLTIDHLIDETLARFKTNSKKI